MQTFLQRSLSRHLSSRQVLLLHPTTHTCSSSSSKPHCVCAGSSNRNNATFTPHASSNNVTNISSSATYASEQATRTVLGCSSALMFAGVTPSGLRAFSTAAFSTNSNAASQPATSNADTDSSSNNNLATSQRVTISPVPGPLAELLSDALLGFGAQSVVVEECRDDGQQEQERFGAEAELWDSCRLLVHFAIEDDVEAALQDVKQACDMPDLKHSVELVVDQEWVSQIKASYVPVQITAGVWIIPDWSAPVDPTATNIVLTPGVAFGTGEHPTTKLCLKVLTEVDVKDAEVVDYGAGSGILAIAALLLGARSAVGTDTDPLAVRAAAANAELNGLQERLQLVQCGANLSDPDPLLQVQQQGGAGGAGADSRHTFDLVMANILRGPLLELQPRLTDYCKPGSGRLVLSGILQEQVPDVVAAYQPHFEDFQVSTEGSWACVTAVRRQAE